MDPWLTRCISSGRGWSVGLECSPFHNIAGNKWEGKPSDYLHIPASVRLTDRASSPFVCSRVRSSCRPRIHPHTRSSNGSKRIPKGSLPALIPRSGYTRQAASWLRRDLPFTRTVIRVERYPEPRLGSQYRDTDNNIGHNNGYRDMS